MGVIWTSKEEEEELWRWCFTAWSCGLQKAMEGYDIYMSSRPDSITNCCFLCVRLIECMSMWLSKPNRCWGCGHVGFLLSNPHIKVGHECFLLFMLLFCSDLFGFWSCAIGLYECNKTIILHGIPSYHFYMHLCVQHICRQYPS